MGIQVSFYKMDFYAQNYESAVKFFESFDADCTVYHDDYSGEKFTCSINKKTIIPKEFREFSTFT